MPPEAIEGFVLHARDYRDTSQLVDIFTENNGRLRLVARGTRSHKKNSARLSPFSKSLFNWAGKGELKTLTHSETLKNHPLSGDSLICGFYLNELLWHLLQPEDSHPELYRQYSSTIAELEFADSLEPLLRNFELNLLEEVGYGMSFDFDLSGEAILDNAYYQHCHGDGWLLVPDLQAGAVKGEHILAISRRDFEDLAVRQVCKLLNRRAIDELLGGKKLNSRELINLSKG